MKAANRGRAIVSVLIAGICFGTSGTASVLAGSPGSPTAVAATRLLVGAIGLVLLAVTQRDMHHLVVLWRQPRVWVMGVCVSAYMVFFFFSVAQGGAAIASLVSVSLSPFLAGTFARLLGAPWPGRTWFVSTCLALVGVTLLSAPTGAVDAGNRTLGVLLATLAGASYAGYTVLGSRIVADGHHATDSLAASFAVGALMLLPLLVIDGAWLFTPKGFMLVLWLGIISTTAAYAFFGYGLTHLHAGIVTTIVLSEPATATILGVAVLGEPMSARGWFGCALIVIGLLLVARSEQRKVSAHA